MTFYEDMQGVAHELLSGEFNQAQGDSEGDGIVYVHEEPGSGPVDNPGTSVVTKHRLSGATTGPSFKYIDGTNILSTDKQGNFAVIPGVSISAEKGYILMDGARMKIIRVDRVPETGTPVIWRVFFRKR